MESKNPRNTAEMENSTHHTMPFHSTTFLPSRGPKGRRLNVARSEFTKQTNPTTVVTRSPFTATNRYTTYVMMVMAMFAEGPAAAIRPVSNDLV